MSEQTDKVKGKTKKVAGDLTGDDGLHAEGEADETAGEAKELIDKIADAAHDGVDWVKDAVKKLRS